MTTSMPAMPAHATGGGTLASPWFEAVEVALVGEDGNAFAIMGRVQAALRAAGVPNSAREQYVAEATSGDYDNLLQVTMKWVSCS